MNLISVINDNNDIKSKTTPDKFLPFNLIYYIGNPQHYMCKIPPSCSRVSYEPIYHSLAHAFSVCHHSKTP